MKVVLINFAVLYILMRFSVTFQCTDQIRMIDVPSPYHGYV